MARWGVLSDIHGNLPALERALAGLRDRGAERVAVLGDNLGRGDSDACISLVRHIASVSVVGNRDLDWQHRVSEASASYVVGLPRVVCRDGIAMSHGDARLTPDLSTSDIRSGFRRARAWLAENGCTVWLFGHSHHARVWTVQPGVDEPDLRYDVVRDGLPARLDLSTALVHANACLVINAGSVGLPFGGKGPASGLVYDSEARIVELFAV